MEEQTIDLKKIVSEKIGKDVKIVYCKPIYKDGEFQYIDIRVEDESSCEKIENVITISNESDFDDFSNLPKNLTQAVDYVISKTTSDDKKLPNEFISADEFALSLHFTTGMDIRNDLKLWNEKNPLHIFLKNKYKVHHPDDMSHLILVKIYEKLKK